MRKCTIIRQPSTNQGTIGGILTADTGKQWFTLELPWLNNESGKSCIPTGIYKVIWSKSPRLHKFTYEIINVPNRGGIRMHGGNFAGATPEYLTHSLGCPLLGKKLGTINGQLAILLSQQAVREFVNEMNREPFELEIKNA